MTLDQLNSLTEDEIAIALHIVNVISPTIKDLEFPPYGLTWFRPGTLERKLLNNFNSLKPEAHPIYSSLLNKLNVQHEIKYQTPPVPQQNNSQ